MTYFVGQDVTVKATITKPDGTAAEPVGVTFRVKPPVGATGVYQLGLSGNVSEEEAGKVYHCTFDLNLPGTWYVRAEGFDMSSQVIGASEFAINVQGSRIL